METIIAFRYWSHHSLATNTTPTLLCTLNFSIADASFHIAKITFREIHKNHAEDVHLTVMKKSHKDLFLFHLPRVSYFDLPVGCHSVSRIVDFCCTLREISKYD